MKQLSVPQDAFLHLNARIRDTAERFHDWIMIGDDFLDPSWNIESCFLQLLAVIEMLELAEFRKMAAREYIAIKHSSKGFRKADQDPNGEPYSSVLARLRCFSRALEGFFPKDQTTTVTKDLRQILRDIHYVIADKKLFGTPPNNENDVHIRIEGVLKCVFPDLKHKPVLTKQIKNFAPDTGIPSLASLIEYKFLSRKEDVQSIADEILADTRGYVSPDWHRFLYVIYETNRFRPENDWNQLLKEAGVSSNTTAIVLSGEPSLRKRRALYRVARQR